MDRMILELMNQSGQEHLLESDEVGYFVFNDVSLNTLMLMLYLLEMKLMFPLVVDRKNKISRPSSEDTIQRESISIV